MDQRDTLFRSRDGGELLHRGWTWNAGAINRLAISSTYVIVTLAYFLGARGLLSSRACLDL